MHFKILFLFSGFFTIWDVKNKWGFKVFLWLCGSNLLYETFMYIGHLLNGIIAQNVVHTNSSVHHGAVCHVLIHDASFRDTCHDLVVFHSLELNFKFFSQVFKYEHCKHIFYVCLTVHKIQCIYDV